MNGLRRILYLVILLVLVEFPSGQNAPKSPRYISLYNEAEKLYYDDRPDDIKDSIALSLYIKVIGLRPPVADSILCDSYFKAGIYLQTAGKFNEAIPYFKKAIELRRVVPSLGEQLMYLPNLYLGNSYYSASMLDSAVYYYKHAEEIAAKYPYTEGIERLYNTLGVVNYESGDYQQSKIYFEKALQLLLERQPKNVALVVNFKNNLASSYRQLKDREQAMKIFTELLKYDVNRDEIFHNIGSIYLEDKKDSLALVYLLKVGYNNQNKYNDLGIVYSRLNMMDSALANFKKATDLNAQVNGNRRNIQFAITCKNLGDYYTSIENYDSALSNYQRAVIQLVFDFDDEDIRMNPSAFNGQYSVIELFEVLSAKARTFTVRYQHDHNKNDLLSSIYAYEALYKLADYVIRTYNSEEARLLLTNKKHLLHNEPIEISLKMFEITGDSVYLRHAFRFDEKNKATILALQLQETGSRLNAGIPLELLENEKRLKKEITRLQLSAAENNDSAIQVSLIDKQILLSDLHRKFAEYPAYNNLKFIDNTVDVKSLQRIIPDDYAVLSYHLGDTSMLSFAITKNTFRHTADKIDSSFRKSISELYSIIQITDRNENERIEQMADSLFYKLIAHFSNDLSGVKHLMIVPDDELVYLPFEILKPVKGQKLLDKFSITYNYSCSLLRMQQQKNNPASVLAMAPFIKTLPASGLEIKNISGDKITGEQATKDKFIEEAKNYSVIHLATHANANDKDPLRSFIAFYPEDSNFTSSRLFTNEIAELPLNNVNLVILSACETGAGQLVKGEGLMSITRAFSYAGCQNTIASLWLADDVSTAKISQHFHEQLEKGKTIAEALQQAKINYLNEDIQGRLKSPAYWAHLRFTGTFEKEHSTNRTFIIIIIALVLIAGLIIYFSMRRSSL